MSNLIQSFPSSIKLNQMTVTVEASNIPQLGYSTAFYLAESPFTEVYLYIKTKYHI